MGTIDNTSKCPTCQDLFVDPVMLPCGHNFCLTCIRVVWNADESEDGPFFCPECQVLFPSSLTLEVNAGLQTEVKDFTSDGPITDAWQAVAHDSEATSSQTIHCDHCIHAASVAVKTCLTCDASLCQAHALLHQERAALREHTLVDVTGDPMSLKCREHRGELKLFCMEERVPVCCLCVLVGSHRNHRAVQLPEACSDLKNMLEDKMSRLLTRKSEAEQAIKDLETLYTHTVKSAADFRERISDKYSRIRTVLDGDERLMMQIIDAEESYMTEWLEAQRDIMEDHIREADGLRAQSKQLLRETNHITFLQQITAQGLSKPLEFPPIQEVDSDLCEPERMRTVESLVDDLSVALSQHFPRMWSHLCSPSLDLETAHPKLEVSQDRKRVFWGRQPLHESKTDHRPYDSQYSVLAQDGFTAGQNYWEVIVQEKPYWLIGVTTAETHTSKGSCQDFSEAGVKGDQLSWCIYHGDGQYLACHNTQEKQLSVQGKRLRKLGMLADSQKGELSFYNADTLTLLHRFPVQCTEPLFPTLNPCIDVHGVNRQPLTIFFFRDSSDCHIYTD